MSPGLKDLMWVLWMEIEQVWGMFVSMWFFFGGGGGFGKGS